MREVAVSNQLFGHALANMSLQNYIYHNCLTLASVLSCPEKPFTGSYRYEKAFGDVFEALVGAIVVDSGNSISDIWSIFSHVLAPLIKFSCDPARLQRSVPRCGHISHIMRGCEPDYVFSEVKEAAGVKVTCEVLLDGQVLARANGVNRRDAKHKAAEVACRRLRFNYDKSWTYESNRFSRSEPLSK